MPQETAKQETTQRATPAASTKPAPLSDRALLWALRLWRPAGTAVAVALALLLTYRVIYGTHGISVWQQKRADAFSLEPEDPGLDREAQPLG
jgi:cell division protein FtsB